MRSYVCVRRKKNAQGLLCGDGPPFTVFVTVATPRYTKRGYSFVTVFRQDGDGRKTCLFPAQEVPGEGARAAQTFLESLGWVVRTTVPRERRSLSPHQPMRESRTPDVDRWRDNFDDAMRATWDDDEVVSW